MDVQEKTSKFTGKAAGSVLLTLAAALALWLFIAANHRKAAIEEISKSLETINSHKAAQISAWLDDHRREALRLSRHPFLGEIISAELSSPGARRSTLAAWLKEHAGQKRYTGMAFLSLKGRIIAATPGFIPETEKAVTEAFALSSLKGVPQLTDLHLASDGKPHMAMFSPIPSGGRGGKPLCVLVIQINPEDRFYPILKAAPLFFAHAETLLVRKEGGKALFLNPLENQRDSALKFTRPLTEGQLPAAAALRGVTGFFQGADYRGVKVFSAIGPVPGTDWAVITKVDRDTVIAPAKNKEQLYLAMILLGAALLYLLVYATIRARRHAAEAALAESRHLLAETEKIGKVGGWEFDIATNELLCTEEVARIHELEPDYKFDIKKDIAFYTPESRPLIEQAIRRSIETGENFDLELEIITAKGNTRAVHTSGRADLGKRKIYGFFQDVTERRQAEENLRKSEERYRETVELAVDGFLMGSAEGKITGANSRMQKLAGRPLDKLIGLHVGSLFDPEDLKASPLRFDLLKEGQTLVNERKLLRPDGTSLPIEMHSKRMPDGTYQSIYRDITERKKAEEALRASETAVRAKLQALLSPEGGIETPEMTDIFDIPALQGIMDEFYKLTNIGIGIIDLKGKVLVGTGWQDICTKFHRVHPETAEHCLESDTILTEGVEPGTCRTYLCKNNLRDIATPIVAGGKHIGNLFLGQFLYEDEKRDYALFREQARRYGFDEKEYIAAYERMPRFGRAQVDVVMRFYRKLAELISTLSYGKIKLARALAQSKQAEERLRESQKIFSEFMEHSPVYVFFKDKDLRALHLSRNYEAMLGRPLKELLGKNMNELFPSDLARSMIEDDKRIINEGKEVVVDEEFNGRFYRTIKFPIKIEGSPSYLAGYTLDVTETKLAEEAIKKSERELKEAQKLARLGNWALDLPTNKLHWSDEIFTIFGVDKEKFGASYEAFLGAIHPEDRERVNKAYTDSLKKKSPYNIAHRLLMRDGTIKYVNECGETFYDKEGKPLRSVGTVQDITERKLVEEKLRESEERLRITLEETQIGTWDWNVETDTWSASPTYFTMLGYDPEQGPADRQAWLDRVHPDDKEMISEKIRGVLSGADAKYQYEARIKHADGTYRWQAVLGKTVKRGEGGKAARIMGVRMDITEQKLAAERLARLSDMVPGVVYQYRLYPDGRSSFPYASSGMNDIYEVTPEEVRKDATPVFGRIHPEDLKGTSDAIMESARGNSIFHWEFRVVLPRQGLRWRLCDARPERLPDGSTLWYGIITDITGRKQAELELERLNRDLIAKRQEMENFLYITSHDLRTPLVNIQGFSQNLERYLSELREELAPGRSPQPLNEAVSKLTGKEIPVALKFVLESSHKMDSLISSLLKVARLGRVEMKPQYLEMNDLVKKIVDSTFYQLGEAGATAKVGVLPPCKADPAAVSQLFANLLENSIKYRSGDRPLAISITGEARGARVVYKVADNGSGIAPKDLGRIWDIFYRGSAARPGEGEGIGLTVVKYMTEKNGGSIKAESEEGRGTVFCVELPAAGEKK